MGEGKNVLRLLIDRVQSVVRDGLRISKLAPIIHTLIVLPELAQHIVEFQIGMFESREAARALANDSIRWAFGNAKLAGLLLAILATVRFLGAARNESKLWNLCSIAWKSILISLVFIALTSLPALWLENRIDEEKIEWFEISVSIITLPILVLLVRGLSGDRDAGLQSVFRHGWLAAVRIIIFVAMIWIPLQYLHGKNHDWAFGSPEISVWLLMVFDSVVVGLLATLAGTAMHHGSLSLKEKTSTHRNG